MYACMYERERECVCVELQLLGEREPCELVAVRMYLFMYVCMYVCMCVCVCVCV